MNQTTSNGMVPDVMHNVLEGKAPYEVKEMIKFLISNGHFTLIELNNGIENFPYPQSDSSSKPSVIPHSTLLLIIKLTNKV